MRKTLFLFMLLCMLRLSLAACDDCSIGQPRVVRLISHGTGPDTKWDYWIVSVVVALVLLTLYYSVKWLIVPGEKSSSHIKYLVVTTA